MTIDEWDEKVTKPMREQGAFKFPSRADMEALCRLALADGWSEEKASVFYAAFAHGCNTGISASKDCVFHAYKTAPKAPQHRYVQREQKNDITNLWGLIP